MEEGELGSFARLANITAVSFLFPKRMRLFGQEHDEEQQSTTQTGANKDEIPLEDDEAPSTEANNVNQGQAASETPAQAQAQHLMEDETIPDENISYKPSEASKKFT